MAILVFRLIFCLEQQQKNDKEKNKTLDTHKIITVAVLLPNF